MGRDSNEFIELRGSERPVWQTWAPLAAAVALAVATAFTWVRAAGIASDLAAARGKLDRLERAANDARAWSGVFEAPNARVAVLEPTTEGSPDLRARVTYDPSTQRAVVICENLSPPQGSEYRLWVVRAGAPAYLGILEAGAGGRAVMRLEHVGETSLLSAFAISLEPSGAVTSPTTPGGPMVMLGKLSG